MPETMGSIIADAEDNGVRLDKFLATRLPEMSRSRLQALIAQGCVSSGGGHVTDAARRVKPEQEFTLTIPDAVPSYLLPQDIALEIVYEDKHLLVINKPAGLTVHPGAGNPDGTLVNALLQHCGESLSGVGGVARPGIVHRIDKDTSGLLVVAKNDAAHLHLSAQLAERSLKRVYAAVAWGKPKTAKGTITANIGRSLSNRQKMAVLKKGGKPAVTHYEVVASYQLPVASLLECTLETGRTHQIRVHLSYIGHPLVGDPAYGQSTESRLKANMYKTLPKKTSEALLAFHRQALHAREIAFIHPATGRQMRFEAKLPKDMRELIKRLSS
ncbi:MAG: RluA family pseudouridine synthase [Pseudomonadota bacterium]|nr:RluA family pseudouridine synthase [Pseudomonadota bacterium]MDE3037080.1 RluA family pseudouridine synthase [Pseudomonadota bacterium]